MLSAFGLMPWRAVNEAIKQWRTVTAKDPCGENAKFCPWRVRVIFRCSFFLFALVVFDTIHALWKLAPGKRLDAGNG